MGDPFGQATARRYILAILDGPGMTVFTRRAKEALLKDDMTSADAVNVLRGGHVGKAVAAASGWTYRAQTRRMSVEFSFRGHGRDAAVEPNELVIENAWRTNR